MMERFDDGNMADVYRLGDRVRKPKGTWWPATRQVLRYLEDAGYPHSQRITSESSDLVDFRYVDGNTISPDLHGADDDHTLIVIGTRVREMHDTLIDFRLDPGTETVPWPISPPGNNILCHNDISPWNTVMLDDEVQAFIDWDLVSFGTREWELAWMCWRWAPIYPQGERTAFSADSQAARCRTLLEAYGLDALNLDDFVALIDRRMESALEVVEQLGAQGVPGFDRLLATGMHLSGHEDRAWLAEHAPLFRSRLESL